MAGVDRFLCRERSISSGIDEFAKTLPIEPLEYQIRDRARLHTEVEDPDDVRLIVQASEHFAFVTKALEKPRFALSCEVAGNLQAFDRDRMLEDEVASAIQMPKPPSPTTESMRYLS